MKKRHIIKAFGVLSAITLLISCFFASCEDDYHATVKGIKFYQEVSVYDEYNDELVTNLMEINDEANPFKLLGTEPQSIYIMCEVPSIIREKLSVTVVHDPELDVVESIIPSGKLLQVSDLSAVSGKQYLITVTVTPGPMTKDCHVFKD